MTIKHTGFIIFFLLLFQSVFARKPLKKAEMDSLQKVAVIHRRAEADSIRRQVTQQVFSIGYADSLLQQIEHLHITLNEITNQTKYGFKTLQIERDLKSMENAILIISQNMGRDSTVTNINNLQLFNGLLKNMAVKLHGWRDILYADNQQLSNMALEMKAFARDSFARKVAADTAFANLHLDEILVLKEKWHEAKSSTTTNLNRIGKLQAEVSTNYFDVTELQNKINNELAGDAAKTFGKEDNYIWDARNVYSASDVISYTVQSVDERMDILKYYLALNPEDWAIIIVAGLIFFFWVFRNFRKIKAAATPDNQQGLAVKYLLPVPILSTFIFILGIAPFYGFNQPAIYIEVLHLLILIPLSFLFWRIWPRQLFFYWCTLVIISILVSVMNAIITPGWPLRYFLLALNILSALFGWRFFSACKKTLPLGKVVSVVIILFIIMNLLAVITNIAGRLTLTKILTASATVGLAQIIGLFILVPILTEAFYLQMKGRRITGGMSLKFDYHEIQDGLYKLLAAGAVLCWLVTLATNLEIYGAIASLLDSVLNTPRNVGSTVFTIGNILAFILILYIATVLQKYIGYFFGETEDDFLGDLDKKESRLVLFRLVIIMVGFFMAVVASGLPVDKVTVVLGALGVGIGLGLQNIVYNLVSGVILIFEKPMKVGDYIEVADKQGRVQNIGIRSSKLITSDGSEVIVPNGDILSSHMVNWTRSNNNRRTQLAINIEPATQLEAAKSIILEILKHSPYVIPDRPVEILVTTLSEKSADVSINVWINSIYKEQQFKSETLGNIYTKLAEKGIKIV